MWPQVYYTGTWKRFHAQGHGLCCFSFMLTIPPHLNADDLLYLYLYEWMDAGYIGTMKENYKSFELRALVSCRVPYPLIEVKLVFC